MIRPRDDVALMDGYHSPQLDVAVRLNTNESPYGPPEAWVDELAGALGDVAWNRYPDREATALREALAEHHGTTRDRVFVANGSNEVLQSVLLAYGGPGRTAVTFEPTYGSARFGSALTVDDFTKQVHVVTVDRAGFELVAPHVETLAEVEGFDAHARSVRLRRGQEP